MKPIKVTANKDYGGSLVTSKYSPLTAGGIRLDNDDRAQLQSFVDDRLTALQAYGQLGTLELYTEDWATLIASQRTPAPPGMPPQAPLVTISSNRSSWIKAGYEHARAIVSTLPNQAFTGVNDLTAISQKVDGYTATPAWYLPIRVNEPTRASIVVVHRSEYVKYLAALAGTGLIVVGWSFKMPFFPPQSRWSPLAAPRRHSLVGFGASRYAAIEFLKYLRRKAVAPWRGAWLLDDNVIQLTSFTTFNEIEGKVTDDQVCLGVHGGTRAYTQGEDLAWANRLNTGVWTLRPVDAAEAGPLQQAVYWNIARLYKQHINFSPIFMFSGEDISMENYLKATNETILRFNPSVRKEDAWPDGDEGGAELVAEDRNYYGKVFALSESGAQYEDGAGAKMVPNYIKEVVLPGTNLRLNPNDRAIQIKAQVQSVEQIICKGIAENKYDADAGPLHCAFKLNGNGNQTIDQIDQ